MQEAIRLLIVEQAIDLPRQSIAFSQFSFRRKTKQFRIRQALPEKIGESRCQCIIIEFTGSS